MEPQKWVVRVIVTASTQQEAKSRAESGDGDAFLAYPHSGSADDKENEPQYTGAFR